MINKSFSPSTLARLAVATLFAMAVSDLHAAVTTYTWDASGGNAANPTDGSGTWAAYSNPLPVKWSNGSADSAWNLSGTSSVIIGNGNGAAGTISITTYTVNVQNITFNAATSGNYTIADGGGGLGISSGTSIFTTNADATISAKISGGSHSGSLIKAGAGTLTLSGADGYSSATVVQSGTLVISGNLNTTPSLQIQSGATLQLNVADATNNSAALIMNGGTLKTGGFGQEFNGGLTLQGTATIDLGGAGKIQISDSHTLAWNGTLSITDWVGSTSGGGTTVFKTGYGATALTSAQLADIVFVNPTGDGLTAGDYSAKILSNGEIVPGSPVIEDYANSMSVPESSSLSLVLIFGGGILMLFRRIQCHSGK